MLDIDLSELSAYSLRDVPTRDGLVRAVARTFGYDSTRALHARTAFARGGARHLQGCYADLDGLLSTLAVLSRKQDMR